MAEVSWSQQVVDGFFGEHKSPSQFQCDQPAVTLTGASEVHNVETPGSMSYTVICTGCPEGKGDLVLSLREPEARLDEAMNRLARAAHGDLIPETSCDGLVEGSEPPLAIYTMRYLRGVSCLDALLCQVEMDKDEEARHSCFTRHLARYFARCWSKPQQTNAEARAQALGWIRRRLSRLEGSSSVVEPSVVSELEDSLTTLLGQDYPQVLTHGDLSQTKILVDEDSYEITGVVDWSLATVLPFGMELDSLFLETGYMDLSGWHNYACRARMQEAFWKEFWSEAGIEEVHGSGSENWRSRLPISVPSCGMLFGGTRTVPPRRRWDQMAH